MRIGVGLRPMSSTTQVTSQAKCEPSVPKGEGVDAVIHLAGNGLELADLVVLGGRFASTLGLGPDQFCNRGLDQQGTRRERDHARAGQRPPRRP